jgi:hypothetical protein
MDPDGATFVSAQVTYIGRGVHERLEIASGGVS